MNSIVGRYLASAILVGGALLCLFTAPLAAKAVRPAVSPGPGDKTLSAAVYGDRLGQALAQGLALDAGDWLTVANATGENAGLAGADFDDWLKSLRVRLEKPDRPPLAIVMLGSNDRRPLPDGAVMADPASPRWEALYRARIDALAATFREAHVPLLWVGLPSVHGEKASADFVRLNGLYRDRATQNGATFIDSFDAFSDETGGFNPMGPDVDGRTVKLRKADGVGFTMAGARKLASFVEGDIKRLEGATGNLEAAPPVADIAIEKARDFDLALSIDVNAQIQREAGLMPESAGLTGKSTQAPMEPAAGPALPLTAAPLSPDGQLAGAPPSSTGTLQATLVSKAPDLVPAVSRPGRTDDFSWPRP